MGNSLISADNTWALWAIVVGWASFSIWLEQKYVWASKISGAIIALVGAMVLSNLNIIPTDAGVYDVVWGYVVPLAIPMLLYQANIKKIWKESGRLLGIFLIGAFGTSLGVTLAFFLFKNSFPDLYKVAGMITGSYIGGGVNFVAMADAFSAPGEVVSATIVADNLNMAVYFLVLMAIPNIVFFRSKYNTPLIDQVEKDASDGENLASSHWKSKEISLKNIAFTVSAAFIIVAVSTQLAKIFGAVIPTDNAVLQIFNSLFGNKYLIITTVTMLLATFADKVFGNTPGASEIGTFLIYLFFMVIGVPASIMLIVKNSPILLVFCLVVVIINMLVMLTLGKAFKFNLEEILLASNANIGGPTTAVAMAIAKGWTQLIAPTMLVGTLGYIIGNYAGIIIGNLLKAL
jgi:uncharacterized membrane protein